MSRLKHRVADSECYEVVKVHGHESKEMNVFNIVYQVNGDNRNTSEFGSEELGHPKHLSSETRTKFFSHQLDTGVCWTVTLEAFPGNGYKATKV